MSWYNVRDCVDHQHKHFEINNNEYKSDLPWKLCYIDKQKKDTMYNDCGLVVQFSLII